MAKQSPEAATPVATMPKAEALAKIAKQVAEIKVQLEASKLQLKAAVKPARYALNFQVNGYRSQANFWKAQMARLKKEPKTEINWTKEFGA